MREVVRRFGRIRAVIALQIANEVNISFSPDSSDGAYERAPQALVAGVIAAKREVRRLGLHRLKIGFNWFWRLDPATERRFWGALRDGGRTFARAVDWIGLDAYPGTVFPATLAPLGGERDAMVSAMRSLRCYARSAGISAQHADEGRGERLADAAAAARLEEQARLAARDGAGGARLPRHASASATTAGSTCATPTASRRACSSTSGCCESDYTAKPAFGAYRELVRRLSRKG